MATSGSSDFSTTTTQIISDAFSMAGMYPIDDSIPAADYLYASRILNAMIKNWSSPSGRPLTSEKMWTRKRGTLFLQNGQSTYDLGPSGDEAAAVSYVSTTLSADAIASDAHIHVTSDEDVVDAMVLGIQLDSGSMYWDVVSGTPSSDTITLTSTMPSKASSGNLVVAYATTIFRPTEILSMTLVDTDGNRTQINPMALEEYTALGKFDESGDPSQYLYEPLIGNGKVYFDFAPNDVTKVVDMVYRCPIYDFDSASDEPDLPPEWYEPLISNLAVRLCIGYKRTVPKELTAIATLSLSIAQTFEPTRSIEFFQPGKE